MGEAHGNGCLLGSGRSCTCSRQAAAPALRITCPSSALQGDINDHELLTKLFKAQKCVRGNAWAFWPG